MGIENMKILIIGLGSMGKRRVRNLQYLGLRQIWGLDIREDRRNEVETLYGVLTYSSFEDALENDYDAFIISLPPDIHHVYMGKAVSLGKDFFVEASVIDIDFNEIIGKVIKKNIVAAPSCTLLFHPAIKIIFQVVQSGSLGKISNFIYHSGQYLPDWHAYEKVSEYYVSKKNIGGGREIVPFELTWITKLLGFPERVVGMYKKTINIEGAENIDDTYNVLMDYGSCMFNLTVDVVSRHAVRRLLINGAERQLIWDWDEQVIKIFDPNHNSWELRQYNSLPSHKGYNKNITEQMYIEEIESFLKACDKHCGYPNTLEHDRRVLKLLSQIELTSDAG